MEESKNLNNSWSKEADKYLHMLISIRGDSDWDKIAIQMKAKFPHKHWSNKCCKERWNTIVDQSLSRHPWSEREEFEMLIAYRKYQNRWSNVSQSLNGRDNNTIKNRFYSIFRK